MRAGLALVLLAAQMATAWKWTKPQDPHDKVTQVLTELLLFSQDCPFKFDTIVKVHFQDKLDVSTCTSVCALFL